MRSLVFDDNGDCSYSSYSTCSHGTKVAGNVAGQTNNGKGKSAIGYNCKLMVYRGLSYSNITNAALDGADVINCSWGSFSYSSFNQTLINAAENEGAIIVAAAGNQPTADVSVTDYMYPASYNNVISVMAVDSDKKYGCVNCSSIPIQASRTFIQNDKIDVASPDNIDTSYFLKTRYETYTD